MTKDNFREQLKKYFNSISKTEPVTEKYATGDVTAKGEPVYGVRNVLSDTGECICVRHWFSPPSVAGLCLYLGIGKDKLDALFKKAKNAGSLEYCKLMFEGYAEQTMHEARQTQTLLEHLCENSFGVGNTKKDVILSLDEKTKLLSDFARYADAVKKI